LFETGSTSPKNHAIEKKTKFLILPKNQPNQRFYSAANLSTARFVKTNYWSFSLETLNLVRGRAMLRGR